MKHKDYYRILGVASDAPAEEIKRAYRRLARRYHPDVSREAQAEAHFKEASEAYEVLRDPGRRAAYDRRGRSRFADGDFRPPPGGRRRGNGSDFNDIFGSKFGNGRFDDLFRRERRRHGGDARGQDQETAVEVSLEEAFSGTTRDLTLRSPGVDGLGGISPQPRTLRVRIPPGVQQGQRIRLAGQGGVGLGGGPRGDLLLRIELQPHRRYRIDGRDVHLELPVAPWEAALGAKLEVSTLGGAVGVSLPPGSQSGRKLRLRGRGLPGSPPGDQYVIVKIVTPAADTPGLRRLYEELARKSGFDPRADVDSPSL